MRILIVVCAGASALARRIAADQSRALAAAGVEVRTTQLDGTDGSPASGAGGDPLTLARAWAEVVHLYPGEATSAVDAARLADGAPLVLMLPEPTRGGAALAPLAERVVVPSRQALVQLFDRVELAPRVARILFPGSPFSRRAEAPVPQGTLRLVHLGERGEEAGLEDLVEALAGLPAGSVRLDCVGPEGGGEQRLALAAAPAVVRFHAWPRDGRPPAAALAAHLAVFPTRTGERYVLGIDDALALGIPVLTSGGGALGEWYDQSAFVSLPALDVQAWRTELEGWIDAPARFRRALASLPESVSSSEEAAAVLLRWSGEILSSSREFDDPLAPPRSA